MLSLFISDLHLDPSRPAATNAFLSFLEKNRGKGHLFILGDLFEAWIGDDDPNPHYAEVMSAMAEFSTSGCNSSVMHGNRDFLLGDLFCKKTGFTLVQDSTVLQLGSNPVLLLHGDTLCTEDSDYQAFRRLVRDPKWQADFLAQSLEERHKFAAQARTTSKTESSRKPEAIMDVSKQEVSKIMQARNVSWMIHGHTHRPKIHEWFENNTKFTRIVLGDWYERGSVLRFNDDKFDLQFFDF